MATCARCGRESSDDARFCAGCGSALDAPAAPREERKVVTIVFADLVGSTALAERSDPEDVWAMLAAHHARVRAELERFGGTVGVLAGESTYRATVHVVNSSTASSPPRRSAWVTSSETTSARLHTTARGSEACRHIVEGRLEEAGETLHVHGARAYAAMVRLLAAELAGRETPGLREAVAFYGSVGASAYLTRAGTLLRNVG